MTSIQTLLAGTWTEMLPTIGLIACGCILFVVFLAGFNKGYRRISRSNLYKIVAGVAFLLAYGFLWEKNPLTESMEEKLVLANALWAIALAAVCALLVLLCYGAMTALFKPREGQREYVLFEDGIEYDEDVGDEPVKRKVKSKKYKPNFIGRLAGGIFCTLNFLLGLLMIAAFVVVLGYCTDFATGSLSSFYSLETVEELMTDYLVPYALDVVGVGVVFLFAFLGYKNGFVGSLWMVLKQIGLLSVIAFCIAVPFMSAFEEVKFLQTSIEKAQELLNAVPEGAREIASKIAVGVVFAVVAAIALGIFNRILRAIANQIDDIPFFRAIDGGLASVVYTLVGVAICLLVCAVLYCVAYCGYLDLEKLFDTEKPTLAQNLLSLAEEYCSTFAEKYLSKFIKD